MLICPFCQFENSNTPEVCQRCGESFQTWQALCIPHSGLRDPLNIGPFLDAGRRYGLTTATEIIAPSGHTTLRVIDHRPDEASPLHDLQSAWLDNPQLDPSQLPSAQLVPVEAFPYLALQADYFPAVPEIHDAFHHDKILVLLLEDRTTWPILSPRWRSSTPVPLLQQTQWLLQIALLWEALIPWQQEATLLQLAQLVVDSNDLVCLKYISPNRAPQPASLVKLGQCWQRLVVATDTSPPALLNIIHGLIEGNIATIHQVKEALALLVEQCSAAIDQQSLSESGNSCISSFLVPDHHSALDHEPLTSNFAATAASAEQSNHQPGPYQSPLIMDSNAAPQEHEVVAEAAAAEPSEPPEMPTMVLPMKLVQIDEVGQTHVGMQRNHNEDCFFAQTNSLRVDTVNGVTLNSKGLYIVCDGMGGHASGEVASQMAVKTLKDFFAQHWQKELPDHKTLERAVFTANQAIYDTNQANATSGLGRMGTTLVMLLIHNLTAAVVHVGDSRLYSYCKRLGLKQLTLDHEVGQREINRGMSPSAAYSRPDAYQLTQALGPRHQTEVKPSINYHNIAEDTLFLLCSDGLSDNNLLERYEASHIAPLLGSKSNLESGLADLIDLANDQNGHDNVTAILTRLKLRPDMRHLTR